MKKDYFRKLKFSVLLYFLLFTAIIIGSLWFFQIFFLENYYQDQKIKSLKSFGRKLCSEEIRSSEFTADAAQCNESGIRVFIASGFSIRDISRDIDIDENSPEFDFVKQALDKYSNGVELDIIPDDNKTANAFFFCSKSEKDENTKIILICSKEKINEAITVFNCYMSCRRGCVFACVLLSRKALEAYRRNVRPGKKMGAGRFVRQL